MLKRMPPQADQSAEGDGLRCVVVVCRGVGGDEQRDEQVEEEAACDHAIRPQPERSKEGRRPTGGRRRAPRAQSDQPPQRRPERPADRDIEGEGGEGCHRPTPAVELVGRREDAHAQRKAQRDEQQHA